MPYIQFRIAAGSLHQDQEARIAWETTRLMAELMGKRAEVTVVEIVRCDPSRWYGGGHSAGAPAAYADVKITRGTNTEPQKAALLDAIHRMLVAELGPMSAPAYIAIHEIAATDWGYDGQPQVSRIQRPL